MRWRPAAATDVTVGAPRRGYLLLSQFESLVLCECPIFFACLSLSVRFLVPASDTERRLLISDCFELQPCRLADQLPHSRVVPRSLAVARTTWGWDRARPSQRDWTSDHRQDRCFCGLDTEGDRLFRVKQGVPGRAYTACCMPCSSLL